MTFNDNKAPSNELEFGAVEERQLLDILVRFPHYVIRICKIWKQELGFRSQAHALFPDTAQRLLLDTVEAYFARAISAGHTLPEFYCFQSAPVLTSCLEQYAQERGSEFIDPDAVVKEAVFIYANPKVGIGPADGKPHLDALWKPYLISKARVCMAAMIQARIPVDERKIMRVLDNLRGSGDDTDFETSQTLFVNAAEEHVFKNPTGFAPLDAVLDGGLSRDANLLMFGNNGAGKSTIANQFSIWMATNVFRKRNELVVYCSSEQPNKQHFRSAMSCSLATKKNIINRHFQNPTTLRRYMDEITQPEKRAQIQEALDTFINVTSDTLFYLRFPKKGAVNIADWLPVKIKELQDKTGKKLGAAFLDWFGRTMCGKPDESRLVGEMNITAERLTTMMDADGGFDANLVVLAQAVASGYGSATLKAQDIGNAKNITDSFENVMGITSMMAPPAIDESGELSGGDRKRYREFQLLNLVKARDGEPCDIPFRRDYANSRILQVNAQ